MKKKLFLSNTKTNRSLAKKEGAKEYPRKVIILMSMPVTIHTVTAVLDMPDGYADRLVRADEILPAITGNTYVTIDPEILTAIAGQIDAYRTAVTGAARMAFFPPLHNSLKSVMRLFQDAADLAPATAQVIIESGKFKAKNITPRQKQQFEVTNSVISGTMDLVAETGEGLVCHDWFYSSDGINFTRMEPTTHANTHKHGLTPGDIAYFQHQLITKDGGQGLSQIVSKRVN